MFQKSGSKTPIIIVARFGAIRDNVDLPGVIQRAFNSCLNALKWCANPNVAYTRASISTPHAPRASFTCEVFPNDAFAEGLCVKPAKGMEMPECGRVSRSLTPFPLLASYSSPVPLLFQCKCVRYCSRGPPPLELPLTSLPVCKADPDSLFLSTYSPSEAALEGAQTRLLPTRLVATAHRSPSHACASPLPCPLSSKSSNQIRYPCRYMTPRPFFLYLYPRSPSPCPFLYSLPWKLTTAHRPLNLHLGSSFSVFSSTPSAKPTITSALFVLNDKSGNWPESGPRTVESGVIEGHLASAVSLR